MPHARKDRATRLPEVRQGGLSRGLNPDDALFLEFSVGALRATLIRCNEELQATCSGGKFGPASWSIGVARSFLKYKCGLLTPSRIN